MGKRCGGFWGLQHRLRLLGGGSGLRASSVELRLRMGIAASSAERRQWGGGLTLSDGKMQLDTRWYLIALHHVVTRPQWLQIHVVEQVVQFLLILRLCEGNAMI